MSRLQLSILSTFLAVVLLHNTQAATPDHHPQQLPHGKAAATTTANPTRTATMTKPATDIKHHTRHYGDSRALLVGPVRRIAGAITMPPKRKRSTSAPAPASTSAKRSKKQSSASSSASKTKKPAQISCPTLWQPPIRDISLLAFEARGKAKGSCRYAQIWRRFSKVFGRQKIEAAKFGRESRRGEKRKLSIAPIPPGKPFDLLADEYSPTDSYWNDILFLKKWLAMRLLPISH
ncbi:hypothetical protein V8E36_008574 [Tilletia maclaganii]